jgi:hypothetical protein
LRRITIAVNSNMLKADMAISNLHSLSIDFFLDLGEWCSTMEPVAPKVERELNEVEADGCKKDTPAACCSSLTVNILIRSQRRSQTTI